MSDWTRDSDGNFVNWLKEPHTVRGVFCYVLPGERQQDLSVEEIDKRRNEWWKLTRRQRARDIQKRPGTG